MINFISSWAEQIIIVIIISSIIEMILPNGNSSKYIKMVLGIYILFTIISPIIIKKDLLNTNLNSIEEKVDAFSNDSKADSLNQTSMNERLQELYLEELKKDIKKKMNQEGLDVISCNIDANLLEGDNKGINKISLVLSKNNNINNEENKSKNLNINSVERVNIKVGLEKFLDNEEKDGSSISKDIEDLKTIICNFYDIDRNKVVIKIRR